MGFGFAVAGATAVRDSTTYISSYGTVCQVMTRLATGGSSTKTAAVASRRSAPLQTPKSRTIGTGDTARTAKPTTSARALATIAGPTRTEASAHASAGSAPALRAPW